MRKLRFFLGVALMLSYQLINAQDIFKQHGFDKNPLTLSNGRYNEFFNNEDTVQIGTVLLNSHTNEIIAFVDEDTAKTAYLAELSSRWLSIDPLAAKYPQFSPYVYVTNNPIIKMDPDGREGVIVVDKTNHILTVTAIYYVNSKKFEGQSGSVYSPKQIERMNTNINESLNGKGYIVSEGEYAGYSVNFDLQFKEGGNVLEMNSKLGSDKIEGYSISNTFQEGNDRQFSRFKEKENSDGTTSTVGGFTSEHKQIIMNTSKDTKHNRIHEIFHTLFFDNDNAKAGIGSYNNPQNANQNDINSMINNSALPKVEVKKPDDENK